MEIDSAVAHSAPRDMFLAMMSNLVGIPADGAKSFIENGGHSIIALKLITEMQEAGLHLDLTNLMNEPTLDGALRRATLVAPVATAELEESDGRDFFQPTPQERSLAMMGSLGLSPFHPRYLVFGASRVDARVDVDRIVAALSDIVIAHPPLNTRLAFDEYGILVREDLDSQAFEFRCVRLSDLSSSTSASLETRLSEAAVRLFGDGVQLGDGPALRAALVQADDERVLLLCLHHSVSDAEGVTAIASELDARLSQPEANWSARVDSAYARQARLDRKAAGRIAEAAEYWKQALAGLGVQTHKAYAGRGPRTGARMITRNLPSGATEAWSRRLGITPGALWTAILGAIIWRTRLTDKVDKLLIPTFASLRTPFAKIRPLGYSIDIMPLVMPASNGATLETSARELQAQRQSWISGLRLPLPELLAEVPEAGLYFNDRNIPLFAVQVLHQAQWSGQFLKSQSLRPPSDYQGDVIPLDCLLTLIVGDNSTALSICGDEKAFDNPWFDTVHSEVATLLGRLERHPELQSTELALL